MKNKIIGCIALLAAAGVIAFVVINNKDTSNDSKGENTEITTSDTIEITTSEDTEELLIGLSDIALSDEVKAQVEQIAVKVNEYYVKNRESKQLISAYGMLYNNEKSNVVTASDLMNEGIFSGDEEVIDNIDILLMTPNDVAEYSEKVDKKSDILEIFTVFNSNEGYFVVNDNYESFVMDNNDYENLVMSYSYINGDVRNPKKGDEDYMAIMSVINFSGEYDVKHIACDDKYAVVVVGSLEDTTIVKEYVLCNDGDGWEIGISGLEAMQNVALAVNSVYPKMEIGMLPKYEIAPFGEIKNGFSTYIESLIQLGMLQESDLPATYTCGAGKFAYIECGDKKLLGCLNDQNKLEFYQVSDLTEAIAYMLEFTDNPPVFILNFDN